MALTSEATAWARRNPPLAIVGVGAGVVAAWAGVQMIRGRSATPAAATPPPSSAPSPVPSDYLSGAGQAPSGAPPAAQTGGGGGGGGGLDMATMLAALMSAQGGGQQSGSDLAQAGLQAGVGLGTAGLQAGVDLGSAGLGAGTQLGLGGLQVASDATGYLGSALETSVNAQAAQTLGVTGSLTDMIGRISGGTAPWWAGLLGPAAPPAYRPAGQSQGGLAKTSWSAPFAAPRGTTPGAKTPVGHIPGIRRPHPIMKPPVSITKHPTGRGRAMAV